MSLSVLVISYNVRDYLCRCLASLDGATEVIVVDNHSQDGSAELVRQRYPHMRVLELSDNCGFSAAVNAGARCAAGELLLILNPDTELTPGSLATMERALSARGDACAMGFRQVDENGRFQLAIGPPPWLSLELVRKLVQDRLDRGDTRLGKVLDRLLARPTRVPWVGGSVLLVRREAFERIGGFDERFFLYFEDIDFCLRLRAAGGRVYYDPSVTVLHHRGVSAARSRALASRAYRESQLYFWEKHRGPWARELVHFYQRRRGLAPEQLGAGSAGRAP